MKPHPSFALLCALSSVAVAQPALTEPAEFPQVQPGPLAVYSGDGCYLLAEGTIIPGDVDWIQIRFPWASTRTVVDVDFVAGPGASAMLAMVVGGTTGFNIGDNNNTRDALCGLSGASSPLGDLQDSVVDLGATFFNSTVRVAVTGASDSSFVGLHSQFFTYQVWVYAEPYPCANDASCNDGVACTVDQCDTVTGECASDPDDSACDDDFFCNGQEWCDAKLGCQYADSPDCSDGVDCTDDWCDYLFDQCMNEALDFLCDNDLFCDGEERCDAQLGCVAGDPVDCNDGLDCTVDACDEDNWVCLHAVQDACDDGLYCNGPESCDAQDGCMSGANPCPDSQCRESDDRCVECLTDAHCDDGVYCNGVELCNSLGACMSGPYPCGDQMCREEDDQCVECLAASDCDDGEYCNGMESCSAAGQCSSGAYPCGDSLCRESDDLCVDCLSDVDCDDTEYCNGAEYCDESGSCQSGAMPCSGALCRESDDRCVECLADSDCADDLFCNGDEACSPAGDCTPGANPCAAGEICDEATDECASLGFSLDVRPGVCPARMITAARGALPVAVVGVEVGMVDFRSLRLERVDGVGDAVEPENATRGQAPHLADVCGPSPACECQPTGPDGGLDLVLSFNMERVTGAMRLNNVRSGETVELRLTGMLTDGRSFSATDCVVVQSAGRGANGAAQ